LLQVPPITQADSTNALEAAESLGIPVWRFQSYQPGVKAIEMVPVGELKINSAQSSERYRLKYVSINISSYTNAPLRITNFFSFGFLNCLLTHLPVAYPFFLKAGL
jgi:hypothetical protein